MDRVFLGVAAVVLGCSLMGFVPVLEGIGGATLVVLLVIAMYLKDATTFLAEILEMNIEAGEEPDIYHPPYEIETDE